MPVNAVPKPEPRWREKAQRVSEERKALKECYAQVDRRDEFCCRVCKARVGGIGMLQAVHHHHLTYRSVGGEHLTNNVISLCVKCHDAVHRAEIRLTGDANARGRHTGLLCGVKLERYSEAGWRVERML